MNILILTGKLKENPTLKNSVARATIVSGKQYFNIVAFGKITDELIKFKANNYVIIQGEWQVSKFDGKTYYQCVVNEISAMEKPQPTNVLDNSEIIEDSQEEINDLPDDDLPF